jgi:hypothetical protein
LSLDPLKVSRPAASLHVLVCIFPSCEIVLLTVISSTLEHHIFRNYPPCSPIPAFESLGILPMLSKSRLTNASVAAWEGLQSFTDPPLPMPEIICNRENCGRRCADGEALLEHLRKDHPTNMRCYVCMAAFGTDNKALIDHFEEKHPEVNGDLKVPCTHPGCLKTVVNQWYLNQHLVLEHGIRR